MSVYVLRKAIWDERLGMIAWAGGLAAMSLLMMAIFPSYSSNESITDIWDDLPEAFTAFVGGAVDLGTVEGWLAAEMFGLMVPIIVMGYAITKATGAIAGEEERGTLEFLLANPITRTRVVVEKALAVGAGILFLVAVMWVSLVLGGLMVGTEIPYAGITRASTGSVLLGLATGSIALFVGAMTGKRMLSAGVGAAVALVSWLGDAISSLVDVLEPVRFVSLWYYGGAGDLLTRGFNVLHVMVLLIVTAAGIAGALITFNRRDLA